MSKLTRRTTVLAKTNSSDYGTDPTPTAGDNGILCNMTPSIQPDGDVIERNTIRDTMSPEGHVIGGKYYQCSYEMELKGGGLDETDAVQNPEYHPFLLASGMQRNVGKRLYAAAANDVSTLTMGETVTGGTSSATGKVVQIIGTTAGSVVVAEVSGTFQAEEDITGGTSSNSVTLSTDDPTDAVIYKPQSDPDSVQDVAVYYNMDGTQFKSLGGICDMSLNFQVNQIPSITFNVSSLYNTPTAVVLPSPTTVDLTPPKAYNMGARIGTYTPTAANALTLSMNNQVTRRDDLNATYGIVGYRITARSPQGSIDPEIDAIGTFDPYTAWENVTAAAVSAAVGSSNGNRVGLCVPKGIYRRIEHQDRNGYRTYNLPFTCRIDDTSGGGDDEFYLIFS